MNEGKMWNDAYTRGGNIVFYPHEEIVRFVNRYVRKRVGINKYVAIMGILADDGDSFASLDLGCGIGRHVRFLDEFGLNPYGVDLSETAISIGKEWMKNDNKEELAGRLLVANVTDLPFEDNYFGICVSHGVLDSMPREIAVKGMKEVRRVLKPKALMYLDLIMGTDSQEGNEVVDDGYEKGTIQSYFTVESIREFLKDFDIVDFSIINRTDADGNLIGKRAHVVIMNRK